MAAVAAVVVVVVVAVAAAAAAAVVEWCLQQGKKEMLVMSIPLKQQLVPKPQYGYCR